MINFNNSQRFSYLLLFVFQLCLYSDDLKQNNRYIEPEFYSIGMLPENSRFVCINGEKWLEEKEEDKIVLQKLFFFDEETNKEEVHKCL